MGIRELFSESLLLLLIWLWNGTWESVKYLARKPIIVPTRHEISSSTFQESWPRFFALNKFSKQWCALQSHKYIVNNNNYLYQHSLVQYSLCRYHWDWSKVEWISSWFWNKTQPGQQWHSGSNSHQYFLARYPQARTYPTQTQNFW